MSDFTTREERLLRALDPPPMSAGFGDRVMAGLTRQGVRATGRDRRGGWRRASRPLLAGVGLAILSVGAAASGLLGTRIQNMPVIATIAETVAPAPIPAPKTVQVAKAKPKAAPIKPVTPEIVNPAPLPTPREVWREQRAERIVDRLERRAERRAAAGLPPVDPQARRAIRRQLAAMPPAERRALIREIREERLERMTPEQRERWEARREQRRTLRDLGRDGLQGGPLIVPESSDPPVPPTP